MRSVLLVSMLLCLIGMAVAVEPEAAVMNAPQVDDVTLLQMDSQAHTTSSSVASIEAELAAALSSQQSLQAELDAQTHAEVGAEAAVDSEALAAAEESAATESDSAADSESVSELEAEFEAQAAAEVEAEAESESKTETETETESESDSELVSGHAVDTTSGAPAAKPSEVRLAQKPKSHKKKHHHKKGNTASYKKGELRTERSDPNGAPDIVHLPNGKKLYKSWIVNPNLRLTRRKPKRRLKHSKERVMTPHERHHLSRRATLVSKKHGLSKIRKEFLRLNPSQRARKLRKRNLSPVSAFLRAFRRGQFPQLKFDPPTGATISHSSVTQHLTVRHHSPSVRQRAEVSALRAASRTLRRINSKRHEFKRALRALRLARNSIQKQIHHHHVLRAVKARKVAARAARRAAWSALLQHRNLRKELMRKIARALRKGHLTGDARRQAIAALIKQNISPAERARLHAFIKGNLTRKHRHSARRARANARKASKTTAAAASTATVGQTKQSKDTQSAKATARVGQTKQSASTSSAKAIPRVGLTKQSTSVSSAKATARVGAAAPAAATAAPATAATPLSAQDQKAIDALIARIRAAVVKRRHSHKNRKNRKGKVTPIRFAQVDAESEADVEAEVEAEAENETSATQELEAAERLAAEAEASAVEQLSMDESSEAEVQENDQLLAKAEAEADAAAEETDNFLASNGVA